MAARAGVKIRPNLPNDTRNKAVRELERRQIEERAYQIYLERGDRPGGEVDDWLQAEAELRREAMEQSEDH